MSSSEFNEYNDECGAEPFIPMDPDKEPVHDELHINPTAPGKVKYFKQKRKIHPVIKLKQDMERAKQSKKKNNK